MSFPPSVLSTESEPMRQGFKSAASVNVSNGDLQPRFANCFHSPICEGPHFISISSTIGSKENAIYQTRHSELKNKVRRLLITTSDPFKELDLVDKIQQLGIGYHFEAEIEDILQRSYNNNTFDQDDYANLYYISLRFRLLRQAGFYVSPVIFNKFKDEKGEFHKNITSDIQGMLSLYEATFLSIQGEDILDDAQDFSTKHLRSLVIHLVPPFSLQVQCALRVSLHNGVERVHARQYISIYEEDDSRIETVLDFAKLDFNIVQSLHKEELFDLSRCWSYIITATKDKLPFNIRDRMVESYVLCMGTNSEPSFSLGRIHLTKIWFIYSLIDDAFEVYEDIKELRPFHDAFQRWNAEDLKLMGHRRVIFQLVINIFNEIKADVIGKRQFIGVHYLKKRIQCYAKAQFEEAQISSLKDLPTFSNWLSISTGTGQLDKFLIVALMNMGEYAIKEIFDWIDSDPDIIIASAKIARLLDDIADFKTVKEEVSNITCYMNEYGVSEQEAIRALQKMIKSLWKDMNKALIKPTLVPRTVLKIIVCLTRNIIEHYTEDDGDGYTDSHGQMKEIITMLLRDHVLI